MTEELSKLLGFVPEKWRPWLTFAICISPLITRAIYALINNGGIRGVICSIWLGTNTPKEKVTIYYPRQTSDASDVHTAECGFTQTGRISNCDCGAAQHETNP